jgi:hypothetical protein
MIAGKGPVPLGFLIDTEKETDLPPSVDVIESNVPEKEAVTDDGFLGKSPSSCACRAALTSLFLQSNWALVVTAVPSKNSNGFGNLALLSAGIVDGTAGHAAA